MGPLRMTRRSDPSQSADDIESSRASVQYTRLFKGQTNGNHSRVVFHKNDNNNYRSLTLPKVYQDAIGQGDNSDRLSGLKQ